MRARHLFGASGFSAMAGRQVPLRGLSGWVKPLEPPPAPAPAPTPAAPTECPQGQILVDGVCQPAPSAEQVTTPPEPTPAPVTQATPSPQPQPQPISTTPQPISTASQPQPISTTPQPQPSSVPIQSQPISTVSQPQPIPTASWMGPEVLVQIPPPTSAPSPCDAGAWLRSKPALGRVRLRRGLF